MTEWVKIESHIGSRPLPELRSDYAVAVMHLFGRNAPAHQTTIRRTAIDALKKISKFDKEGLSTVLKSVNSAIYKVLKQNPSADLGGSMVVASLDEKGDFYVAAYGEYEVRVGGNLEKENRRWISYLGAANLRESEIYKHKPIQLTGTNRLEITVFDLRGNRPERAELTKNAKQSFSSAIGSLPWRKQANEAQATNTQTTDNLADLEAQTDKEFDGVTPITQSSPSTGAQKSEGRKQPKESQNRRLVGPWIAAMTTVLLVVAVGLFMNREFFQSLVLGTVKPEGENSAAAILQTSTLVPTETVSPAASSGAVEDSVAQVHSSTPEDETSEPNKAALPDEQKDSQEETPSSREESNSEDLTTEESTIEESTTEETLAREPTAEDASLDGSPTAESTVEEPFVNVQPTEESIAEQSVTDEQPAEEATNEEPAVDEQEVREEEPIELSQERESSAENAADSVESTNTNDSLSRPTLEAGPETSSEETPTVDSLTELSAQPTLEPATEPAEPTERPVDQPNAPNSNTGGLASSAADNTTTEETDQVAVEASTQPSPVSPPELPTAQPASAVVEESYAEQFERFPPPVAISPEPGFTANENVQVTFEWDWSGQLDKVVDFDEFFGFEIVRIVKNSDGEIVQKGLLDALDTTTTRDADGLFRESFDLNFGEINSSSIEWCVAVVILDDDDTEADEYDFDISKCSEPRQMAINRSSNGGSQQGGGNEPVPNPDPGTQPD